MFIDIIFRWSSKITCGQRGRQRKKTLFLKIAKPLRSLRLCGESIHLVDKPDTNLLAQLDYYSAPIDLRQL
jgi:hypothetical protein